MQEDGTKGNYTSLQFHFHANSEHTIDGKHYPLELHIVTKNLDYTAGTRLAVFGIFFEETENKAEETTFFKKFLFPTHVTTNNSPTYSLDFRGIFNLIFHNK